jgi:hypothetical protein
MVSFLSSSIASWLFTLVSIFYISSSLSSSYFYFELSLSISDCSCKLFSFKFNTVFYNEFFSYICFETSSLSLRKWSYLLILRLWFYLNNFYLSLTCISYSDLSLLNAVSISWIKCSLSLPFPTKSLIAYFSYFSCLILSSDSFFVSLYFVITYYRVFWYYSSVLASLCFISLSSSFI